MRTRMALLATLLVAVSAPAVVASAGPAAAGPPVQKVVQLGDSYSAGNGTQDYVPANNDCFRSPMNWGGQFAASQGATYVNRACSGAVTANITGTYVLSGVDITKPQVPFNQTIPGSGTFTEADYVALAEQNDVCPTPSLPDERYSYSAQSFDFNSTTREATGTILCSPYMEPQIDAVDTTADVVLLTIGGNDIGFSTIVEWCFVFQSATNCENAVNAAQSKLPALKTAVLDTLRAVRARMRPDAVLIYEGYPYLAPNVPLMLGTYNANAAVRQLGDAGSEVQRQVIAAMNGGWCTPRTYYSDVAREVFAGHELNANSGADNSNAWFVKPFTSGYEVSTWYHPIAYGWDQWADGVIQYYDTVPAGFTCSIPASVPGAPTGVTAAPGDGKATVSWTAPGSDGGSAITGYVVQQSVDAGTTWTPAAGSPAGPTATSLEVTGLTNGINVSFRVAATNAVGQGPYSTPSVPVTPGAGATVTVTSPAASGSQISSNGYFGVSAVSTGIPAGTTAYVTLNGSAKASTTVQASGAIRFDGTAIGGNQWIPAETGTYAVRIGGGSSPVLATSSTFTLVIIPFGLNGRSGNKYTVLPGNFSPGTTVYLTRNSATVASGKVQTKEQPFTITGPTTPGTYQIWVASNQGRVYGDHAGVITIP
ncbi:MAG: fibronectin type III domain-containing protein [Candidatus Nanopelagicales bacterium]